MVLKKVILSQFKQWDKFLISDMQRAMASDSLVTSRPVVAKSLTVSEVNAMFDRITYNKGSSVLRMMQQFLGEPTFLKGLKVSMKTMIFRSTPRQLRKSNWLKGGLFTIFVY